MTAAIRPVLRAAPLSATLPAADTAPYTSLAAKPVFGPPEFAHHDKLVNAARRAGQLDGERFGYVAGWRYGLLCGFLWGLALGGAAAWAAIELVRMVSGAA